MKSLYAVALPLVSLLFLAGCSVKEVPVAQPQVIEVPDGKDTKPVSLGKIVFQIPAGKQVVRVKGGLACVQAERDATLPAGDNGRKLGHQVNVVFYEELKKANYNVIGDPGALFDEDQNGMAEFAVSGAIKDMWVELCYPFMRWGNLSDGSGGAIITVEWQVYSRLDKKVLYKTSKTGSANNKFESDSNLGFSVLHQALANSVQGLLADKSFHNIVSDGSGEANDNSVKDDVLLQPIKASVAISNSDSYQMRSIKDVTRSVVTIRLGSSWGSGFLVSKEGYVITNRHVVGEMKRARVEFLDGTKVEGEVLLRDASRDVALIKIPPTGAPSLVVNTSDLPVGSDVYAIGSPKELKLAGTVTKGVISGYRQFNRERWIQADAAINPGNSGGPLVDAKGRVVGISTLARRDAQGIFFFVPISEALSRLHIEAAD